MSADTPTKAGKSLHRNDILKHFHYAARHSGDASVQIDGGFRRAVFFEDWRSLVSN